MAADSPFSVVATDVLSIDRSGPDGVLWSLPPGADMNANVVHLGAGGTIGSHTNDEVDVLLVGLAGRGVATIDGARYEMAAGTIVAVPKHLVRSTAAHDGHDLLYLTVHIARPGPQIAGPRTRPRGAKEER
jgi:quercetin dioxygenase-like cupin family protein